MSSSIFKHLDYKVYLWSKIRENKTAHGYKTQLARAAGCRNSHLSQVLNGDFHLNPEHVLGLANHWQLDPAEKDYFVQLVNYARAGTPEVRKYYEALLRKLSAEHDRNKWRGTAQEIADDWKPVFYSSWHYTAIHELTTFPSGQTAEAIARRLDIPEDLVDESLRALEAMGLVESREDRWHARITEVIVPVGTQYSALHVSHWSHRAALDVMRSRKTWESLHKCWIFGIHKSDFEKLKEFLAEHFRKSQKVIAGSAREELVCMNVQLFVV